MLDATGRLQLIQIEVRELSIVRKFINSKINRFVLGLVSEAFRNQCADHRTHLVDVTLIGRSRIIVRPFDPQRFGVFGEYVLKLLRKFCEGNFRFARATNRFVIHVGDVHHTTDFESARFEVALK